MESRGRPSPPQDPEDPRKARSSPTPASQSGPTAALRPGSRRSTPDQVRRSVGGDFAGPCTRSRSAPGAGRHGGPRRWRGRLPTRCSHVRLSRARGPPRLDPLRGTSAGSRRRCTAARQGRRPPPSQTARHQATSAYPASGAGGTSTPAPATRGPEPLSGTNGHSRPSGTRRFEERDPMDVP